MGMTLNRTGSLGNPLLCHRVGRYWVGLLLLFVLVNPAMQCQAQIGGKTAAQGPFMLDNAEDLDTTASGVDRAWIPDFVPSVDDPFNAVPLITSGLTLAADQTATGALRFDMFTHFQYIDYSFGVPTPSVPGASTLTHPGDISSFSHVTFLVCLSRNLANHEEEFILTTYPGPNFPTLHYKYSVTAGSEFQRVTLDLSAPSFVLNGGGLAVADLLKQVRFLSFYFFAGPEFAPKDLTAHVDDIELINISPVENWTLY